jgi:hypothetical protein
MDLARIELGRLSAYKNPHAWAVPDGERGKHQYLFFLDKDTPSAKDGDLLPRRCSTVKSARLVTAYF